MRVLLEDESREIPRDQLLMPMLFMRVLFVLRIERFRLMNCFCRCCFVGMLLFEDEARRIP